MIEETEQRYKDIIAGLEMALGKADRELAAIRTRRDAVYEERDELRKLLAVLAADYAKLAQERCDRDN